MKRMAVLFRSNSGAKPNPVKGFYTALAMFLPLLVLTMLGQRAFGVLVMTGALLNSFGDIDTSYRIQAWSQPPLTTLTAQLTLTSPLLRFSSLRAVGAAGAAGSGWILGGPPFYWAALTVIICTQQDQKASLMMALQYVVATYLGALLADVLIAGMQNVLALELIVVAITVLAFTIKDLNYLLYLFFFTILILLLISIGMSGQSLAVWRVVTILIGAWIVLVITFLSQLPFFKIS
jgi:uncharacterized membrane protein YccC